MRYELASSSWDHEEIDAIHRVIESDLFSMGEEVSNYERRFADYFGADYAIMTSSGSTANLLMIAAMFFTNDRKRRLVRGDEIIVPAVSWSTTYFPLQQYGLKVTFVDIDRNTLNIDLEKLSDAITDRTRAILAVNLLGNPNDFDSIQRLIAGRNITLLEDNCESLGAEFGGKYAGTFGLMGTFSSFYSHHIATMEGGCVITDDEELYHILLTIRAHGWTRNLPEKNLVTGTKSEDPFDESFRFVLPGYNVRPLEMSGAIGTEQLKKVPQFINQRVRNADFFLELFSNHPWIEIQQELGKSSWFGFSMTLKEDCPVSRKSLVQNLAASGIDSRPIVTGNFLKNKEVLQHFDYVISGTVENAEYIDKHGFFVGNHQVDIGDKIQYLYDVIADLLVKG